MLGRLGRWLPPLIILPLVFLVCAGRSAAQEASIATLTSPDTSAFPHLTAFLDVHDPAGAFIHGFTSGDILLQENDLQVPVSELEEQKPGVQFVIAITPGESFAIRDAMGTSRYEYLLQGILAGTWKDQPSNGDDFSLLTMGGPQLIHSSDPGAVQAALVAYLPDASKVTPNLEVLASALQVAGDTPIRPGMERAILFITSPQESQVSLGLQSILSSAIQQNIHIYVWLVAAQEVFDLPEIDLLRNLATQTQATFFAFSHDEPVPDLESILEPLRYIYRLGYDSRVTQPGAQQVVAQVSTGSALITSQPVSFEVDLQLPVITLLTPPIEIVRTFSGQSTEGLSEVLGELEPNQEVLNIRVTFPDGYERSLTRTSLYVDGTIVAENTSPPFDQFIWDLHPYNQDGAHVLSIEVIDSLGLIGKSGETLIKIKLPSTTQGVMVTVSQNKWLVIGVTALIVGSILVLGLILGGRIRPKLYPGQVKFPAGVRERVRTRRYHLGENLRPNMLSQPAKMAVGPPAQTRSRPKSLLERLPWFRSKAVAVSAMAYLLPLAGLDEITLPAPMQVVADEVTLGCDPRQADLVIADPSIEGLHARIQHEGKSFIITDAGSVAGTWVNFAKIPPQGTRLEHADIIHLGQVGFRFNLAEPDRARKIVVTPVEPER